MATSSNVVPTMSSSIATSFLSLTWVFHSPRSILPYLQSPLYSAILDLDFLCICSSLFIVFILLIPSLVAIYVFQIALGSFQLFTLQCVWAMRAQMVLGEVTQDLCIFSKTPKMKGYFLCYEIMKEHFIQIKSIKIIFQMYFHN